MRERPPVHADRRQLSDDRGPPVTVTRGLLRGERVIHTWHGEETEIRFLDKTGNWYDIVNVPIWMAAGGPKGLESGGIPLLGLTSRSGPRVPLSCGFPSTEQSCSRAIPQVLITDVASNQQGIPLPIIMRLLGQENASTTAAFYPFATVDMMRAAVNAATPAIDVPTENRLTEDTLQALCSLR